LSTIFPSLTKFFRDKKENMGIDNPVGGHSKDPYERYRIIRENQEHHQREGKPPNKKPHLAAQILALIKGALEALFNLTKRGTKEEEASPREHLFLLKIAFETLKQEERNQDVFFLNQMSDTWHRVLEDSLHCQRSDPFFEPFQNFLEDIQHYPPGEEHSFGYYLTEYTGQQWLPFPYMDLVHKIHEDYQNNPRTSALERWTQQIDELLEILSSS
jgi:hypothetical protein